MQALNSAFISAQNHLLKRSPWALERLRGFSGKAVILVSGSIELRFAVDKDGYLKQVSDDFPTDVRVVIPFDQLPLLAGGGSQSAKASFRLEGDADLAEAIGFVFRNLRWDIEEDLSHLVGDIMAHRLGVSARWAHKAHVRAWEGARDNAVEYLTEEARLLVTSAESAELMQPLLALRDDLARCEKRLERISRSLPGLQS
ncbi:MAG: hypothetical protein JNK52_15850 [Zoogloeaceae bacterium]|nr:hypothetical protein [Zoogloeaceae bacterium]